MPLTLQQTTPPTAYPVTLDHAKKQCRILWDDENDYISDVLIPAATQYVQNYLNRQLITATWKFYLDEFPREICVPRAPVQSITSIEYVDTDGVTQTLAASTYRVDVVSQPARIVEAWGKVWPSTQGSINSVIVTYVAGYGATYASVPADIRAAILLLIGHWFENRETILVGTSSSELDHTFSAVLGPNKLYRLA